MKQLTLDQIVKVAEELKTRYNTDLSKVRIFLGNDEELNGVHYGWDIDILTHNANEDFEGDIDIQKDELGILLY